MTDHSWLAMMCVVNAEKPLLDKVAVVTGASRGIVPQWVIVAFTIALILAFVIPLFIRIS